MKKPKHLSLERERERERERCVCLSRFPTQSLPTRRLATIDPRVSFELSLSLSLSLSRWSEGALPSVSHVCLGRIYHLLKRRGGSWRVVGTRVPLGLQHAVEVLGRTLATELFRAGLFRVEGVAAQHRLRSRTDSRVGFHDGTNPDTFAKGLRATRLQGLCSSTLSLKVKTSLERAPRTLSLHPTLTHPNFRIAVL